MLKITIIYDNTAWLKALPADWGFACLVEARGKKVLFDTGAKGPLLLGNMQALQIDPLEVDTVFISHNHWDHTGGLADWESRESCVHEVLQLRLNLIKAGVLCVQGLSGGS